MRNETAEKYPYLDWHLEYKDTQGEELLGTRFITEMICANVSVFIGPEGKSCYTEAMVAWSRNLPMISYVSIYSIELLLFLTIIRIFIFHFFCSDYQVYKEGVRDFVEWILWCNYTLFVC